MANYTNIVNIVNHVRRARLGLPQTSYIVNPWSIGCAFVSLQVSLNYFLHEHLITKQKLVELICTVSYEQSE